MLVKAGTNVATGAASRGARAYLAIAGGFQVPEVLGSRSTYIPAEFGGLSGRALKAGDRLPCVAELAQISASRYERIVRHRAGIETACLRSVRWFAPELTLPANGGITVRAIEGRHHAQFDSASQAAFFDHVWRISPASNRMGYRLEGPRLSRTGPVDILSEPICLGTVQVPNDGAPIALMADHQTTGGYPKIAEIASVDVPGLAQVAPGGSVRFAKCPVEKAEAARLAADEQVREVLQAIEWATTR